LHICFGLVRVLEAVNTLLSGQCIPTSERLFACDFVGIEEEFAQDMNSLEVVLQEVKADYLDFTA